MIAMLAVASIHALVIMAVKTQKDDQAQNQATLKFTYEKTVDSSKHFATEPLFLVSVKGGTGEFAEWQSRFYQSSPILILSDGVTEPRTMWTGNLKPEPRPQGLLGFSRNSK